MTRSGEPSTRVHYKGSSNDFVIFAESSESVHKWRKNHSVPLAEVVNSFHIFTSHRGSQGLLDAASNAALDNEFGTHDEDEVVKKILEQGEVKDMKSREREGGTNTTRGSFVSHA